MELGLKREHWLIMRTHVQALAPLEACGLLAGKNNSVENVLLIANQARSRVRFRMDPKEQLQAFDWIASQELDLVGIFHSHPAGPETVSATDIAEAAYAVTQIIWSRTKGDWIARGFWIEDKQATQVTLKVIDDEQP
ncbi:MAG TPA: M67 family metallopeptidase [Anaerolineales bacterium]|nr:M67 family metallopeptidase [Anaerolineales bacterium]